MPKKWLVLAFPQPMTMQRVPTGAMSSASEGGRGGYGGGATRKVEGEVLVWRGKMRVGSGGVEKKVS